MDSLKFARADCCMECGNTSDDRRGVMRGNGVTLCTRCLDKFLGIAMDALNGRLSFFPRQDAGNLGETR